MGKREKVLIFNVNWLGDVLFSTAAIRAIKKHNPLARISCLVVPSVAVIIEDNPNIDEIIIYDEKGRHKGLFGKLSLIKNLKTKGFDKVFLLHRSMTRALICFLACIPERIGYHTPRRGFLLTTKVHTSDVNSMHRVDYFLNILNSVGINPVGRHYDFFVKKEDEAYVKILLHQAWINENDFTVILHPSGNWHMKRWPKENFAKLADSLIDELGAKVIITGSDKDIDLVNSISLDMKNEAFILTGKLNIKQLAALMKLSSVVISADSGPLHLAAAVGTKTVALFGPTSPRITGPISKTKSIIIQKDLGCHIPCYKGDCQDNRCMKAITPEDVLDAVKRIRN